MFSPTANLRLAVQRAAAGYTSSQILGFSAPSVANQIQVAFRPAK